MDEIVRRAMQKWPNVPAVFGWLSLDLRGQWSIKNERISNNLLIEFIGRNYACDDSGRWFFQNGPQRVFVQLAYAPWVLRAHPNQLVTHTGQPIGVVHDVWIDESGVVLMSTDAGVGTVDDRDAEAVSAKFVRANGAPLSEDALIESVDRLVAGHESDVSFPYAARTVPVRSIASVDAPSRFGFVPNPTPLSSELKPHASLA
jgi:hypothetical protein